MSNSNHARALALARGAAAPAPLAEIVGGARVLVRKIAAYLRAGAEARAERRRARESVRHLMALSNRELKDIGISRSEILSVVYGPGDGRRRTLGRRS
jgi:uncharacterized protein YjiS (DUF1127 family)